MLGNFLRPIYIFGVVFWLFGFLYWLEERSELAHDFFLHLVCPITAVIIGIAVIHACWKYFQPDRD